MASIEENEAYMAEMLKKANLCNVLFQAYVKGKDVKGGVDVPFSAEKITEMKVAFASARAAGIIAWEAVVD